MKPTIYKPSIYKGAGIYKNGSGGGGGGGAYIVNQMPNSDSGNDGEYAILMADVRQVNNGTIIPAQIDMTNCFGSNSTIWQVFDGDAGTRISVGDDAPIEFGYDFGEGNEKSICAVSIYTYNYSKIWFKVRGSNDRKNWTDLAVCTWALRGSLTYSVTFGNPNYYRYYSVICYNEVAGLPSYVREIYMTDDRSVMKDPKTPQFFAKQCGTWNFDRYKTAYDCEPAVVYRVNGRNLDTAGIQSFVGQVSSDLLVELDGVVNPSLYTTTSYSAFFGWDNNAQFPFKLLLNDTTYNTEFQLRIGNSSTSTIAVARSSLLASSTFKVRINKDKWSLYLDDTLVSEATVGGWIDETHDWASTCRVLGGQYNRAESSQLGFSRLKIIDNKYDRLICDIVGAKRALDNTFGFFDRNSGYYIGYASGYVNEMSLT